MYYTTELEDGTRLVIEAETSGAFAKSDLEVRPDPQKALVNAIEMATRVAELLARRLTPPLLETGATADVAFSVKCDHQGMVMVAMNPGEGQLSCTLHLGGAPAAAVPIPDAEPLDWDEEPTQDDTESP